MATTVSGALNLSLQLNESAPQGSTTNTLIPAVNLPINLSGLVNYVMAAGTGSGKINQFWMDVRTLNNTSEDINVYTPTTNDACGNALTIAVVKGIIIINNAATFGDVLTIGGKGTTAAWAGGTAGLFPVDTYTVTLNGGGVFMALDTQTGFVVGASTTNHLLTMATNANFNYTIAIIGSTS